jgi:RNA polymerase sigma-70 factor (ECF subfamily)
MLYNADDTEDVLQQSVLAMWQRFNEYDRSRSFFSWARQFVKFSALNHIRAKRRNRVVFSDDLLLLIAENEAVPTDDNIFELYQESLLRCMDRLSTSDRELLELCYFEKCSITKASAKLGRSPQSTCNSLRRIRVALFDCIAASVPLENGI